MATPVTGAFNLISSRQRWINQDGTPTPEFFRFISGIAVAVFPSAISSIVVGASPFTFATAFTTGTSAVIIQGGTVSKVEFTRDSVNFINTGQTQGMFPLSGGDSLRVTYTGLPTMTFLP